MLTFIFTRSTLRVAAKSRITEMIRVNGKSHFELGQNLAEDWGKYIEAIEEAFRDYLLRQGSTCPDPIPVVMAVPAFASESEKEALVQPLLNYSKGSFDLKYVCNLTDAYLRGLPQSSSTHFSNNLVLEALDGTVRCISLKLKKGQNVLPSLILDESDQVNNTEIEELLVQEITRLGIPLTQEDRQALSRQYLNAPQAEEFAFRKFNGVMDLSAQINLKELSQQARYIPSSLLNWLEAVEKQGQDLQNLVFIGDPSSSTPMLDYLRERFSLEVEAKTTSFSPTRTFKTICKGARLLQEIEPAFEPKGLSVRPVKSGVVPQNEPSDSPASLPVESEEPKKKSKRPSAKSLLPKRKKKRKASKIKAAAEVSPEPSVQPVSEDKDPVNKEVDFVLLSPGPEPEAEIETPVKLENTPLDKLQDHPEEETESLLEGEHTPQAQLQHEPEVAEEAPVGEEHTPLDKLPDMPATERPREKEEPGINPDEAKLDFPTESAPNTEEKNRISPVENTPPEEESTLLTAITDKAQAKEKATMAEPVVQAPIIEKRNVSLDEISEWLDTETDAEFVLHKVRTISDGKLKWLRLFPEKWVSNEQRLAQFRKLHQKEQKFYAEVSNIQPAKEGLYYLRPYVKSRSLESHLQSIGIHKKTDLKKLNSQELELIVEVLLLIRNLPVSHCSLSGETIRVVKKHKFPFDTAWKVHLEGWDAEECLPQDMEKNVHDFFHQALAPGVYQQFRDTLKL